MLFCDDLFLLDCFCTRVRSLEFPLLTLGPSRFSKTQGAGIGPP